MARAIIHIVRHGETDENRQRIIQGQLNTVLNAAGLDQARRVAVALRATPFDMAFSSDLSRAAKTAEAILAYHPAVQLQKLADLRERHMGDLQGQVTSPTATASAHQSIETTERFAGRAVRWWNKILQYLSTLPVRDTPYEILVVSHGGWIGTLVRILVNSRKLRTAQGVGIGECLNVSVTKIEMDDNRNGTVTKYGDISHLIGNWVETNADEL